MLTSNVMTRVIVVENETFELLLMEPELFGDNPKIVSDFYDPDQIEEIGYYCGVVETEAADPRVQAVVREARKDFLKYGSSGVCFAVRPFTALGGAA